jgi:hypothetical protein
VRTVAPAGYKAGIKVPVSRRDPKCMLFTLVGYRKLVRLTSAEAMLARQRERIHQWREAGLDVGKSMALLEVWEQTVEQFRISRRILQSFGLRLRSHGVTPPSRLERRNLSAPLQPLRRTESMAFLCSHCALTLRLKDDRNGSLVYDFPDWRRRCRHKALESPALCQLISCGAIAIH